MLRYVSAALLLAACGPHMDLDEALVFNLSPDVAAATMQRCGVDATTLVKDVLADAAAQLHTSVGVASANPAIQIEQFGDCGSVVGHGRPGVMELCGGFLCNTRSVVASIIMHELGHALGAEHVECNDLNVMCGMISASTPPQIYSDVDVATICRWSSGGVCRR